MKKIIIILLTCTMLFSGCESSEIESFGAEYSSEDKYMAMLPNGISVPMEYNEVLKLKGESQYGSSNVKCWGQGDLYYDETFLNRQCILGLNFESGNLKELAHIFKCKNKKEAKKTIKYIYNNLKKCYGEPNTDALANIDISNSYYVYATWSESGKYWIELSAEGGESKEDRVICEIRFYNSLSGIESETTTYTTTTAYEWKLNTDSTGYDWISVNNTEKEVWCSNSIAAWRLMGYDIPDGVSTKSMVKAIDKLYEDETYLKYDLATISEMFAIANDIY